MSAHTGTWNPGTIASLANVAGGVETVHASVGAHAEQTWANAATIAAEWLVGVRTTTGGLVYNLASPVSVVPGDVVSFSIHSGVGVTGNIAWARLVDATTGTPVYGYQDTPSIRNGVPYFDIVADGTASCDVEFLVYDDALLTASYFLLEKNGTGDYFDGSLVRGGWLGGSDYRDYRWEGGAANENDARSLYSEDYERTRQIVDGLYDDVLPVTVAPTYQITYNNVS
jgi:hypothetical protein